MRAAAGLLLCLLLTGCIGFGGIFGSSGRGGGGRITAGDGFLVLQNQRTGERIGAQFRQPPSGALDPAALWQLSHIMRDTSAEQSMPIDVRLFDLLDSLTASLGLPPGAVVVITSGYRSPITNNALRRKSSQVAESSYHLRAMAADIKIPGVSGSRIAAVAKQMRLGGVAYYASSDHVHVDVGPVRSWSTH